MEYIENMSAAYDVDKAVKQLKEKQKAQKVLNIKGDKLKFGTCPACTRRISDVEGGNYCQNCGQALNWNEE